MMMCNCNKKTCWECDGEGKKSKPQKHATLIKAWADGATIQIQLGNHDWVDCVFNPTWDKDYLFRIKPEPDVVMYGAENNPLILGYTTSNGTKIVNTVMTSVKTTHDNVKFTFDGETGKLKSVELIKE